MAQHVTAQWDNWSDGVVTAAEPTLLPPTTSPRGRNSALTRIAPGLAVVGNRKGITEVNAAPITSSPAVIGQMDFKSYSAPNFTSYHLLVCSNGRLEYRDAATTTAPWDSGDAAPFTSSTSPYLWPDFTIANNCAFICNGTSGDNKKAYIESGSRRTRKWGITRPTVGTMAGAAGAAGLHNGTYELRATFRNTRTGVESSASDTATATVVVANQQISWTNVPVSADAQVDQRRLWVRNVATQANFYLAGTIDNNSGTTQTTNIADTSLVTIGPDTAENDPPVTFSCAEWHQSRMFGAGPDNPATFYYSHLGNPEAFDPDFFEYANPKDGQRITALHSAHGVLLVFKENSTWVLLGDDPNSWEIRPLFLDVGCVSHRTVLTVDGITYWQAEQGPMSWDGVSARPVNIALGLIGELTTPSTFNAAQLAGCAAIADQPNQRILFALPEAGNTRSNIIYPYNYLLKRWDADRWEIIDVASFGVVDDSTSTPTVFIGAFNGQIFKFWDSYTDGAPSGTLSGAVTSATSTTLVDSGATFKTSGTALVDRYVYVVSPAGVVQRRLITTNNSTTLTVSPAWTTTPTSAYFYIIGAIDFQWDLSAQDFQQPFWRKRLRHLFLLTTVTGTTTALIDIILDGASSGPEQTWVLNLNASAPHPTSTRTRIGLMARELRFRFRLLNRDIGVTLHKVACTAELTSDHLDRGDTASIV